MPIFPTPPPPQYNNVIDNDFTPPNSPMSGYLPLTGGTITGNLTVQGFTDLESAVTIDSTLNMQDNQINQVADGTSSDDAATVAQLTTGAAAINTKQQPINLISHNHCTLSNGIMFNKTNISDNGDVDIEQKQFGTITGTVDLLVSNFSAAILLDFDNTVFDDISKISVTAVLNDITRGISAAVDTEVTTESGFYKVKFTADTSIVLAGDNFKIYFIAIAQNN